MKGSYVVVIGLSVIIAFFVLGLFIYNSRAVVDSVNVVGAATKRFESDIVKWRIYLSRDTDLSNVSNGYKLLQNDMSLLKAVLAEKGLSEKDMTVQPINTMQRYNNQGQATGYTLQQGAFVITSNLTAVEELALNPAVLMDKGVVFQNSNLEYFYSKLADIKMELLADATKDARRRAEEIAGNAGMKLGAVTSLRAGVFQITEPFSAEVSDYGMYNTQTKQKDITVTVRAAFKME